MHKTYYDLQMPIIFTHCFLIYCKSVTTLMWNEAKLNGVSRQHIDAWNWTFSLKPTIVNQLHQQDKGKSRKHTVGSSHASAIQPPAHTHPPGRQWAGNTATAYGAERSFLLVSSSFHIFGIYPTSARKCCVFAWTWLKESDRNFFPGQKSSLITPTQLECEATLPEPFMHKAHCLGGICHQLFYFYMHLDS